MYSSNDFLAIETVSLKCLSGNNKKCKAKNPMFLFVVLKFENANSYLALCIRLTLFPGKFEEIPLYKYYVKLWSNYFFSENQFSLLQSTKLKNNRFQDDFKNFDKLQNKNELEWILSFNAVQDNTVPKIQGSSGQCIISYRTNGIINQNFRVWIRFRVADPSQFFRNWQ